MAMPRTITAEAIIKLLDRTADGVRSATKNIEKIEARLDRMGRRMQKVGALMTIGVTVPLVAFGVAAVKKFADAEKGVMRLDQALKVTKNSVGFSTAQIHRMALAMQEFTGGTVDADEIFADMMVPMLKFTKVQGPMFERSIRAIMDVSASMGTDFQTNAQIIGKALQDPIKSMRGLREIGVTFTKEEQKRLAAMIKNNKQSQVQSIILQRIMKRHGGQMAVYAKTTEGRLRAIAETWENFMEGIGGVEAKHLDPIIRGLRRATGWFDSLTDATKENIVKFSALAAVTGPALIVLGALVSSVAKLRSALWLLNPAMIAIEWTAFGLINNWDLVAKHTAEAEDSFRRAGAAFTAFLEAVNKADWSKAWDDAKKYGDAWLAVFTSLTAARDAWIGGMLKPFGLDWLTDIEGARKSGEKAKKDRQQQILKDMKKPGWQTLPQQNRIPGGRGGPGHLAAGGPFSKGDVSWVGEHGPEMVHWGAAGRVLSNDRTSRTFDKIAGSLGELTSLLKKIFLEGGGTGAGGFGSGAGGGGSGGGLGPAWSRRAGLGGAGGIRHHLAAMGGGGPIGAGGPAPTTGAAQSQVLAWARSKNLNRYQTAVLMATIQQESGFRTGARGDAGHSVGLFQMNPAGGRQARFFKRGGRLGDVRSQLNAWWQESQQEESASGNAFRKAGNIDQASEAMLRNIRPLDWLQRRKGGFEWRNRRKSARNWLSKVDAAGIGGGQQAGAPAGGSGGYALGKGKVDMNIRITQDGPPQAERIKVHHPSALTINTGLDNSGARLHRPGGQIGPV